MSSKSVSLNVRVPEHLDDAIERAAERAAKSKAAYVKGALLDALYRDGTLSAPSPIPASSDLADAASALETAGRSFETAIGAITRVASILKKG